MASKRWTAEEIDRLRVLVHQGLTDREIAQTLGRSVYAVESAKKNYGLRCLPRPASPVLHNPARIEGDCLIIADPHIPCHDAEFLERLIELAARWRIQSLGIAGDLLDFETIANLDHYSDEEISVSEQIQTARQVMTVLAEQFAHIVYCAGNHERRLIRRLQAVDTLRDAMSLWTPERVEATDFQWFTVTSDGETFQVEHPQNVSIIPTRVAQTLAAKYDRNVIAGHGHLWGISRDVSGRHWAIDSGVTCDVRRLAWAQKAHNTRPMMLQGAVFIRGRTPLLVSPETLGFFCKL